MFRYHQQLYLTLILSIIWYSTFSQLILDHQNIFCSSDERNKACRTKYSPVCALTPQVCSNLVCPQFTEFSSNCEACKRPNVTYYVPGRCYFSCASINLLSSLQSVSGSPVCGYYTSDCQDYTCRKNFKSSILACSDTSVISFSNGPCENNEEETQILKEDFLEEEITTEERNAFMMKEEQDFNTNEQAFLLEDSLIQEFLLSEEYYLDETRFTVETILQDQDQDVNVQEEEEYEENAGDKEGKVILKDDNKYRKFLQFFCPEEMDGNCFPAYMPVCSTKCSKGPCRRTFDNACYACIEPNVLAYTPGTCEEQRIKCDTLNMRYECFFVFNPVCVYPKICITEPCGITAVNPCQGCSWRGASYFTRGVCRNDIWDWNDDLGVW